MDQVKLKITKPQLNLVSGLPIIIPDAKKFQELGIKNDQDLEDNIDKLDKVKLGTVINSLFDVVSIPNRETFALYSEISIKIRKAFQDKKDTIEMSLRDLETFKKLFEMPPKDKPQFNSQFMFAITELESAYLKSKVK